MRKNPPANCPHCGAPKGSEPHRPSYHWTCGTFWNHGIADRAFEMTCKDTQIVNLKKELAERDASFDLRWKADQRAIKRWQNATGRTEVWPDHADLCVWLLEQLPDAID